MSRTLIKSTHPSETNGKNSSPEPELNWKQLQRSLLIIFVGLWIYWPVLNGDWLWDDDVLISRNPIIHNPAGLWHIWFRPSELIDYFPLTASVQWLEWQLWPNSTFCFHFTNVVLHLCSALLVWRLLDKLGLRLAWLGGLLFAVHPALVESVAWISELKNTLSLPPFLLAMCAWIDFDRKRKVKDYILALSLFLIAMLGKTTMVMFPLVILLYAWWKRGRVARADLMRSAAFFAVSLAVGLALLSFVRHGVGEESIPLGGFFSRLACAGLALAFYFSKCFLPVSLSPIYTQWRIDPPSPTQLLPWPVFAGAIYWLWLRRRSWGRHALLGLGFFLLNLLPFIGFHEISFMRFSWVMDHFLYIPIIGLIGLAVAALEHTDMLLPTATRPYRMGLVAAVVILLAMASRDYASKFTNQETLWTYTLEHNPEAWPAHDNLGGVYLVTGRTDEAIEQYSQALMLEPASSTLRSNLGLALMQAGDLPAALGQFQQALQIWPGAPVHAHLGDVLAKMGHATGALAEYQKTLALDPTNADAHYALGNFAAQAGRFSEAKEEYLESLQTDAEFAPAHLNLGNVYLQAGQIPEAIAQYKLALSLDPANADARCNLGSALVKSGDIPAAIEQYQAALEINPNLSTARMMIERLQASPAPKR